MAHLIKSRNPKKLIVAGGHYASCAAEALLANHPELDIIVIDDVHIPPNANVPITGTFSQAFYAASMELRKTPITPFTG